MSARTVINLSTYKNPDYLGSVQHLFYLKENPEWMLCRTTPGGSVFDVGTIFSIPLSDTCRTALRHKLYSLLGTAEEWRAVHDQIKDKYSGDKEYLQFLSEGILEEFRAKGACTHHIGMVDRDTGEIYSGAFPPNPSQYVVVKRYQVLKPVRVGYFSNNLWDYSGYGGRDRYVIPLENIVRFGITPGSSIYKKYLAKGSQEKQAYLEELGLREEMVPWTMFNRPTVDFTTKYEPEDRNLNLQEAFYISGCGGEMFKNIIRMTLLGSFLVHRFFSRLGLDLWDLKWEIARDGSNLVFVDTIDTDSMRVTGRIEYKNRSYFVNFNKQSMRDYYKIMHSQWFKAVASAKSAAAVSGQPFLEHLRAGQKEGRYPETPEVDPGFISIQEQRFGALAAYIYGRAPVVETVAALKHSGRREIEYYEENNALADYAELNGIG